MTDREKNTIEAMIAGDDEAFAAVYGAFYQKLYRTAYLMSGNRADSEDILQETFVTVYLHRGELKNPMGIEKWIRKILVRKAVKLLKRKKQESSLEALLEELADGHDYGQVLRAKGMLKAADGEGWYYFDLVPGEYEIRMGEPEYTGKVCVIGSGLQEDKLAEAFAE